MLKKHNSHYSLEPGIKLVTSLIAPPPNPAWTPPPPNPVSQVLSGLEVGPSGRSLNPLRVQEQVVEV